MNFLRKPKVIAAILFLGVMLSLVISSPYPFILTSGLLAVAYPVSCFPIVLITPVVEGYLNLDALTPIPVEIFVVFLLFPVLLWNSIVKRPVLPNKGLLFFIGFCLLIVIGTYVAVVQTYYRVTFGDIIFSNIILLLRIIFCLTLSYFFVSLKREGLAKGLEIITMLAPWLMAAIVFYFVIKGQKKGNLYGYINVQNIKHGSFSATIVAFSVFIFYNVFKRKKWWTKALNIGVLLLMSYMIFQMGSKNGLVTLIFMTGLCVIYFFVKGNAVRFFTITFVVVASALLMVANLMDTPVVQRILKADTSNGVDLNTLTTGRTGLWIAGINAFFSEGGIMGYGSTNLASRWISGSSSSASEANVFHNTPLEFAIQYGVFGLLLYIGLVYTLIRYFLRAYKYTKLQQIPVVYLTPFICCFSLLFSGQFLSWQWYSYWWYQVAIIFAIVKFFGLQSTTGKRIAQN